MNYEQFKDARIELSNLVKRQLDIVNKSEYDNVINISPKPSELLEKDRNNLDNENLIVLIMGEFSSGKSTFLNAMIGDDILPMDVRPCTAVIGEISYSDEWNATIYPKNGKWQGGNIPFSAVREQLKELITIKHQDGDAEDCPFEKVIIQSPLQLCKHGIQLIDSPGLNDPTSHDVVTKSYLPNTDAIIYLMNCSHAYSREDKKAIEELRALGYTSIIFVLNFFDVIEMNDIMYGQNEAEKCKNHYTDILSNLTDLGKDGVFFVSSLAAMRGKIDHNTQLIEKSHFLGLEKNLEKILVEHKGRLKLNKIYFETKRINVSNERIMSDIIAVSEKDRVLLEQMVNQAQIPFSEAKRTAELIGRQIESSCSDISESAKISAELFYTKMISNLGLLVDDIQVDVVINNPLKIRKQVSDYTEQLLESLKVKIEIKVKEWADSELTPRITHGIETLSIRLDDNVRECFNNLDRVKMTLDLPSDNVINHVAPSGVEKFISAGASILIGDIGGALMGGALGFKGLIRTLTCEIAAGVVLGIASLFTPIGLPALIIGTVCAIAAGGAWSLAIIEKEINKKVISELQIKLDNEKEKVGFVNKTKSTVQGVLEKMKLSVKNSLSVPINEAKAILDTASANLQNQGSQLRNRISIYKHLIKESNDLYDDMDKFHQNHLV